MAYIRNNIVVRPAYAGIGALESELGGLLDSLKSIGKSIVGTYGEGKAAQGAAAALAAQQQGAVVAAQDTGPSMTTIAVIGVVGLGAVLLLRKKKHK